MAGLYNRVKMTVSGTPGTGTVTLNAAAANNFCTFAEAGVPNGKQVRYVIEDGTDFEIGLGTYTSSGTTLSRDSVTLSKISGVAGTSKITATSSAIVRIDAAAEDFNNGAKPKVLSFTFDTSLSTNFSITGVGFKPSSAFFFATVAAVQNEVAWGATDGTTSFELHGRGTSASIPNYGIDTTGNHMVFDLIQVAGTTACSVSLVSIDSDGFTFARSLTGSPSGTATVFALCFP